MRDMKSLIGTALLVLVAWTEVLVFLTSLHIDNQFVGSACQPGPISSAKRVPEYDDATEGVFATNFESVSLATPHR